MNQLKEELQERKAAVEARKDLPAANREKLTGKTEKTNEKTAEKKNGEMALA